VSTILTPEATGAPASRPLDLGVQALLAGAEPLAPALEALRVAWGAQRALWCSASGGNWLAVDGVLSRPCEVPSDIPGRWLEPGAPAGVQRLSPATLKRDPAASGAGLGAALVRHSSAGVLWLDSAAVSGPGDFGLQRSQGAKEFACLDWLSALVRRTALEISVRDLARRGERSAGVAHDLRNQLSLAILQSARLDLGRQEDARGLIQSLERARSLCEDFLDGDAKPATLGLGAWLQDELRTALELGGKNHGVRLLTRNRAPRAARTSEDAFRRIVANLALNAIAASPSGGCVRVQLRGGTAPDSLELEVRDEGRGMTSPERARLFRPGESRGSSGFGTSSVQDCVERLGGVLKVDTSPGAGTTVTVTWPTSPD
jgi:signal transduction histidine kinase